MRGTQPNVDRTLNPNPKPFTESPTVTKPKHEQTQHSPSMTTHCLSANSCGRVIFVLGTAFKSNTAMIQTTNIDVAPVFTQNETDYQAIFKHILRAGPMLQQYSNHLLVSAVGGLNQQ